MAITTILKLAINKVLRPFNIRLDSWTYSSLELQRITNLIESGKMTVPCYPVIDGIKKFDATILIDGWSSFNSDIERLYDPYLNSTGYRIDNSFFSTPDMEVLYLMVRQLQPSLIVEIGCGNSTRITRQAILDGNLKSELVSIDPCPRADISGLPDRFEQRRLEDIDDFSSLFSLKPGDFLFIDSSHQSFVGNDVANLFCKIVLISPLV